MYIKIAVWSKTFGSSCVRIGSVVPLPRIPRSSIGEKEVCDGNEIRGKNGTQETAKRKQGRPANCWQLSFILFALLFVVLVLVIAGH